MCKQRACVCVCVWLGGSKWEGRVGLSKPLNSPPGACDSAMTADAQ